MRRALHSHSLTGATMPANPSSLLILHPRLNVYLKPFVLCLPHFSSPALSFNRARRFPIPRPPFPITPRNLSSLSSTSVAHSTGENGGGGGRSGALSPPPITEVVQRIDVNPPKGTRDFPPEEMRLRNWLFQNFREVGVSNHIYIYGCMHVGLYLIGGWSGVEFWWLEFRFRDCLGSRRLIFLCWSRRRCSLEKPGRRLGTRLVSVVSCCCCRFTLKWALFFYFFISCHIYAY